jgi:hypothetical protein
MNARLLQHHTCALKVSKRDHVNLSHQSDHRCMPENTTNAEVPQGSSSVYAKLMSFSAQHTAALR